MEIIGFVEVLCRDGKSYKRYKHCWCKEFPTGVKILVESVKSDSAVYYLVQIFTFFHLCCSLDAFFSMKDVFYSF